MRLLLDTHALIWWAGEPAQLGRAARDAIDDADEVRVSAVSVYEMSLKHALGKLPGVADLLPDLRGFMVAQQFRELPLSIAHADLAGRLPLDHRDPFDRMIVAQALSEDLTLVSNEDLFDRYGVRRLW